MCLEEAVMPDYDVNSSKQENILNSLKVQVGMWPNIMRWQWKYLF